MWQLNPMHQRSHGWCRLLLGTGLLMGCSPEMVVPDVPNVAFCEADTKALYDPRTTGELHAFPDDLWTQADSGSPTGLRPMADVQEVPWIEAMPEVLRGFATALNRTSGFGRNGAIFLRTKAPLGDVPVDLAGSLQDRGLMLLDLGGETAVRVPYEATVSGEGLQVKVQPLGTLRPGTLHALVLTTDHAAADGGCVAPSRALRALLTGTEDDPAWQRVADNLSVMLERSDLTAGDVSAVTTFTTHDDLGGVVAAADHIREHAPTWVEAPTCTTSGSTRRCTGTFEAQDYRDDGVVSSGAPVAPWTLGIDMWLPADTPGPWPVVMYGHGMNGRRQEGGGVAARLNPLGFAVVSTDAMAHGEHPTADEGAMDGVAFLGIDLNDVSLDGVALRSNFDQTSLDRLSALTLLRADPDVDGDGTDDLDMTRVGYWGISMGGLLGPGLLAIDPGVDAATLSVGGGHLITFATDTGIVKIIVPFFYDVLGSPEAFERFLAVGQAALDGSDPATWAAHVLRDRLVGAEDAPDLLLPVAMADEVVPPATGRALARSLLLPHVPPVAEAVPLLEVAPGAPLSGNLDGVTAGFFQFDRVGGEDPVVAGHDNTPLSPEGTLQAVHFFQTWATDGRAEIVDPYAELQTAALP